MIKTTIKLSLLTSIFCTQLPLNVFAMEEDDQHHPGGLFKKDPNSPKWMVQCQGCSRWLITTTTLIEPKDKIMKITDEDMQRSHIKRCTWKPKEREKK